MKDKAGENVVEVKNLTKIFNGFTAVDKVTFEIKKGEILGILGPNGAGKTTIIHMLTGVTAPTGGRIRIFGLDFHNNRESILKRINFSSTYSSMPYSLTVRENLRIFAILYGVKDRKKRIDELLEIFGIKELNKKLVRHLSSGQITRLCLVKALLNNPGILLLDEPTASLDPDMADKTRSLLKKFRKERGLSIIYTSHNMKEMEDMSDRLIFLDRGRILATGAPREVIEGFGRKNLEEVFIKVARKQ